jgi:hypothetical protein
MDASAPQWDRYRAHALECLREARAAEDRELSEVFHRLAMWWVILSHEIEDDLYPATSQGLPFARKPQTGAEPDSVSLLLLGNYTAASFNLGPKSGGGTGTVVTDPPLTSSSVITSPQG